MDIDDYRSENYKHWERSARGWGLAKEHLQKAFAPITAKMLNDLDPKPGQRILELAAGPGELGFEVAKILGDEGKLISSDFSPEMLKVAEEYANELRLTNVEFQEYDVEWIDLPVATIDGILCRFGYQFAADPVAAFKEARRALKPQANLVFSVWSAPSQNPWAQIGDELLGLEGLPNAQSAPGIFALSDKAQLQDLLESSGFVDISTQRVDMSFSFESFDQWMQIRSQLREAFAQALGALPAQEKAAVVSQLKQELLSYTNENGSIELPGVALVTRAGA